MPMTVLSFSYKNVSERITGSNGCCRNRRNFRAHSWSAVVKIVFMIADHLWALLKLHKETQPSLFLSGSNFKLDQQKISTISVCLLYEQPLTRSVNQSSESSLSSFYLNVLFNIINFSHKHLMRLCGTSGLPAVSWTKQTCSSCAI